MLLKTSARPNIPPMRTMKSKPPSNCGNPKKKPWHPAHDVEVTVVNSRPSIVEMMTLNGFSHRTPSGGRKPST